LKLAAAAIATLAGVQADTIVMPPSITEGTEVAIVWIHGARCENDAYMTIANAVQTEAAKNGTKVWVGLPQFPGEIPEPKLMDKEVEKTI